MKHLSEGVPMILVPQIHLFQLNSFTYWTSIKYIWRHHHDTMTKKNDKHHHFCILGRIHLRRWWNSSWSSFRVLCLGGHLRNTVKTTGSLLSKMTIVTHLENLPCRKLQGLFLVLVTSRAWTPSGVRTGNEGEGARMQSKKSDLNMNVEALREKMRWGTESVVISWPWNGLTPDAITCEMHFFRTVDDCALTSWKSLTWWHLTIPSAAVDWPRYRGLFRTCVAHPSFQRPCMTHSEKSSLEGATLLTLNFEWHDLEDLEVTFWSNHKSFPWSYNWLVPWRCVLLYGGDWSWMWCLEFGFKFFWCDFVFPMPPNFLYYIVPVWLTAAQWLHVLCHGEFRFPPCTFTCGVMWCHSNLELHHHWCPSIIPKMPWSISTKKHFLFCSILHTCLLGGGGNSFG